MLRNLKYQERVIRKKREKRMICSSCGHENLEDSNFCEACGSKLNQIEPQKRELGTTTVINGNKCPICNSNEKVKKLSAVFESGVMFTKSSGPRIGVGLTTEGKIGVGIGSASDSGVSITAASARLAPPEEPSKGCANVMGWILLFFGGLGFLLGCAMSDMGGSGNLLIGVILGGVGFVLIQNENKTFNNKVEKYKRLINLWHRAYYCEQDDLIFDPTSDFSINASRLQSYYADYFSSE